MHPWAVVDPTLERNLRLRALADDLMHMVRSGWSDLRTVEATDAEVESFLDRHRVVTIVAPEAIRTPARAAFVDRLRTVLATQLHIEAAARTAGALLTDAGIDFRVLKGLASAHLDYPGPHYRQTGDVDLLVRSGTVQAVVDLLASIDARPLPDTSRSPWTTKGLTLRRDPGIELDLHNRLFVRSRPDDFLLDEPPDPQSIPGLPALQPAGRLVNAAGAFMLSTVGSRRMSGLFDITRILDTHEIEPQRARSVAERLRVGGIVGDALRLESELSGRDLDAAYDDWPTMGLLDQRTRRGPRRNLWLEHLVRLRHVPASALPGYLPIWLTPSRKDWAQLGRSSRDR